MDVHPADQHPARHRPHVARQLVIAVLVGVELVAPVREGVARRRNGHQPVFPRDPRHRPAQMRQVIARLGDVGRYRRSDLDLAAQEFGADGVAQGVPAIGHHGIGGRGKLARIRADKQVFFLDAKGERGLVGHGLPLLTCVGWKRAAARNARGGSRKGRG
jgi:hypothetical protein